MPWIAVNMMSGASPDMKRELHKNIAEAVSTTLGIPAEWVKIQLIEMTDENHSIGGTQINELQK